MRLAPVGMVSACILIPVGCFFPIDVGAFGQIERGLEGASCDLEHPCDELLVCNEEGVCVVGVPDRQACSDATPCPTGAFCDRDGFCTEEPGALGPLVVINEVAFGMGEIPLGELSVGDVNIENVGDVPLLVTRVAVEGEGADQFSLTMEAAQQPDGTILLDASTFASEIVDPLAVEPDAEGLVFVVFHPTVEADSTVTIVVETNDPNTPRLEVRARGVGIAGPGR